MDEQARWMEARLDENPRLLQATTEELEKERASRRDDSVEAGREPGSPTIAESERGQDSLLNRFVEQLPFQSGGGAVGATSSSTIVPPPEPQARPGSLVMANFPKFGGDSSRGFVWIKLIVSWGNANELLRCIDGRSTRQIRRWKERRRVGTYTFEGRYYKSTDSLARPFERG